MYKLINKYIIFGILLYVFLITTGNTIWADTWNFLVFNMGMLFTYALFLYCGYKGVWGYTERTLLIIVFVYSSFWVINMNLFYFYDHGDFFQFVSRDELKYDRLSRMMAEMPFIDSIKHFLTRYSYEDLGAVIYISSVYRIIPDTLLLNFANIICGIYSSIILYRIGKMFMPYKYAFMCSLAYYLSSFICAFESWGLKEMFFSLIVISVFYHLFLFFYSRKRKSLLWAILGGGAVMLFRPAVLAMMILSLGAWFLLNRYGSSLRNMIFVLITALLFIYMSSSLDRMTQRFSSFERSVEIRSSVVQESGSSIALAAAGLSSILGPMPNMLTRLEKKNNSFYSTGLLFRVLLSVPFWFGVIHIIKNRVVSFYPIVVMCLLGIGSLFYIMESYELRYHLTYLPFVFIVAFYYLSHLNEVKSVRALRKKRLIEFGYLFTFVLMVFWNLRMV